MVIGHVHTMGICQNLGHPNHVLVLLHRPLLDVKVTLSIVPYRIENERLAEKHLNFMVTPILSRQ